VRGPAPRLSKEWLYYPRRVPRLSLVDPWLHEKSDGFPILYVRSHAARLPGGLVRDWLFRCRVALEGSQGRLVLEVGAGCGSGGDKEGRLAGVPVLALPLPRSAGEQARRVARC
jgi:hypothetical protein